MLHVIWDWTRFSFWLGLICLAAGLVVAPPLMLSKRLRGRFFRSKFDLETIGAIALLVTLLVIGLYNHFGAHGV